MELALALKTLEKPDPELDKEIAIFAGYRPGPNGLTWISPSDRIGKLPTFTGSFDAAYDLAIEVLGTEFQGCSWEAGAASAKVRHAPYVAAKTPAIAISLAVVLAKHFNGKLLPELGSVKDA